MKISCMDSPGQFGKCGWTVISTVDDEKDLWEGLESQGQEREERMARRWFWTGPGKWRNGGKMMKAETQIKFIWSSYKGQLSGSWISLAPSPLRQGKLPQFWIQLVPDEKITFTLGRSSIDGQAMHWETQAGYLWPKRGGGRGGPPRLSPHIIFKKPFEQGNVLR